MESHFTPGCVPARCHEHGVNLGHGNDMLLKCFFDCFMAYGARLSATGCFHSRRLPLSIPFLSIYLNKA